jgi:hypothetical protein
MTLFPAKSKLRSGSFNLTPNSQPVTINHYVEVIGRDSARLITDLTEGRFSTSVNLSEFDNGIGPTRLMVTVSHVEREPNENTIPRAQKVIQRIIDEVGGARYAGFDRQPAPPPTTTGGNHRHRNNDDDDDDDDVFLGFRS